MLEGVNIFYHNGSDTEEELTEVIEGVYNYFHAPANLEKTKFKKYRRATTWFLQSEGFRSRILHFYFDYILPFVGNHSIFEINKLHRKYEKIKVTKGLEKSRG